LGSHSGSRPRKTVMWMLPRSLPNSRWV
jgi:hypothetical protein